LARIFHATGLAPKGLYEMVDSEIENAPAEMKFVDDFVMQSPEELKA